jgi:hypothetical protein
MYIGHATLLISLNVGDLGRPKNINFDDPFHIYKVQVFSVVG